ncbi:MAG: response regulator transcription factor [Bacteroidetes bacterium]|nr:response regulator transcription factor [Bacteroidota bacterium]
MPVLKILIAEEEFLISEGLKSLVDSEESLHLSGVAFEKSTLLETVKREMPDVLIIDHTSEGFGPETIAKIKALSPQTEILAITSCQQRPFYIQSMQDGVKSFLLKNCDREEILSAINATAKGDKFYCSKVLNVIVKEHEELPEVVEQNFPAFNNSCDGINISLREEEIIRLIADGFSNKEIADKLFLSPHTVNTHRKNIMGKLGVNNTAGIVIFAIKKEIISPNKYLFSAAAPTAQ